MSLTDRDYMRSGTGSVGSASGLESGTGRKSSCTRKITRAEQVGLGIAAAAMIALLIVAIL